MSGIICLSWCVILHVLNYILRVCFNDQLTCTNEAAVSIRWMGIRTENHHIFRMDTVMSTNSKVGAGEKARFIPRALKFIQPDLTRARPKTAEEVIMDKTHFDDSSIICVLHHWLLQSWSLPWSVFITPCCLLLTNQYLEHGLQENWLRC